MIQTQPPFSKKPNSPSAIASYAAPTLASNTTRFVKVLIHERTWLDTVLTHDGPHSEIDLERDFYERLTLFQVLDEHR